MKQEKFNKKSKNNYDLFEEKGELISHWLKQEKTEDYKQKMEGLKESVKNKVELKY